MRNSAMTNVKPKLTVYFDGACPLCTLEISHYKHQKGADNLCFVDASSEADLGADLPQNVALGRFHVRDEDGALVSGARAFTRIWAVLPRWRWAARLARLPGAMQLLVVGRDAVHPDVHEDRGGQGARTLEQAGESEQQQ